MNEQQLREGLRAAIAGEPPLGFDPDLVADDARRAVHRRRAVLASAGATVLVVGAIVGTASVAQGPPAGPGTGPTSSTVQAPSPTTGLATTPPGPEAQDPLGLGPQADRIGAHLSRVLPEVVPGARNVVVLTSGQEAHGDYSLGEWINLVLAYDDSGGRAILSVAVWPGVFSIPPCRNVPADRCLAVEQPDGSSVAFREEAMEGQPTYRVRSAYHEHRGFTAIVFTYTYDGFSSDPSPAVRHSFPLTDEQLIRLVTDPALSLSP